jgi:hypothetical protein
MDSISPGIQLYTLSVACVKRKREEEKKSFPRCSSVRLAQCFASLNWKRLFIAELAIKGSIQHWDLHHVYIPNGFLVAKIFVHG